MIPPCVGLVQPVLGHGVDDVTRTDLRDFPAAGLDLPDTFGDREGLTEAVGVPGGAGTGGEVDRPHLDAGGVLAPGNEVDEDIAGEPLGGTLMVFWAGLTRMVPLLPSPTKPYWFKNRYWKSQWSAPSMMV